MVQRPHSSHLRTGRFSQPGAVYLITAVTLDRRPVFADFRAARQLIRTLHEQGPTSQVQTLAYVVMPDHLHWLMQLGASVPLSACVHGVKSMTSRQLGRSIWQAGFHDRAMRREDDLKAIARYIVANPLRAGLATDLAHYPHWDARWLTGNHTSL